MLVTDEKNDASSTRTAVSGATVLHVDEGGNGIGASGDLTVAVALHSVEEARSVANAVDTGHVTLVRTTGTGTAR